MSDHKATYWCDKYHELEAQHKELQRREAMLVDSATKFRSLQKQAPDIDPDELCNAADALDEVISATSANTSAWLEQKHVEWMKVLQVKAFLMTKINLPKRIENNVEYEESRVGRVVFNDDDKKDAIDDGFFDEIKLYALPTKEIVG